MKTGTISKNKNIISVIMKKIVSLIICPIIIMLSLFSCVNEPKQPADVWDGTVASSFAGGDGTKESPYVIGKSSELAYLAESVNNGKSYKGQYIVLDSDLDLNGKMWTPIGTEENRFEGCFNGKDHTLSGLNINSYHSDEMMITDDTAAERRVMGLFGVCLDAEIRDLVIDSAEVTILQEEDVAKDYNYYAGIVAGELYSSSISKIEHIRITNSKISFKEVHAETETAEAKTKGHYRKNSIIGGIAGLAKPSENAEIYMNAVECNLCTNMTENSCYTVSSGTLFGMMQGKGNAKISNVASYGTAMFRNMPPMFSCIGAIGALDLRNNTAPEISNVFSSMNIDGYIPQLTTQTLDANSVIGIVGNGDLTLKGVYGTIRKTGMLPEFATPDSLYTSNDYFSTVTETDCKVCDSLPSECGFDPDIWDLSDLSKPRIK